MSEINGPKQDFFISYNKADLSWAEWIAWQLEEENYNTIIQVWDFRPGDNFVLNMHQATEICERTILVLSQNYLTSLYAQPEWAAGFNRDPIGTYKRVLPIRVQMCEPQGLLKSISYIDLVNIFDESVARQKLLDGVVRGRAKPKSAPIFPSILSTNSGDQPPSEKAGLINAYNNVQTGGITEIDKINELANKLERMIDAHATFIPSDSPQNLRNQVKKYKKLQRKQVRLSIAYTEVKNGQIVDPVTIRSLADEFEEIANDPKSSIYVEFDGIRAAQNLRERANVLEEEIQVNRAELINTYYKVKNGQIVDPAIIRSLADEFEEVANDPLRNRFVEFDGIRVAQNLREQANVLEDSLIIEYPNYINNIDEDR